MRVTVWGNGAWGMALADQIANAGHEVLVYKRNLAALPASGPRPERTTGSTAVTADLAWAAQSDRWLVATPTLHLEQLAIGLRPHVRSGLHVLSCAKGLAEASGERPTQTLSRVWAGMPQATMHALGGPNLAHEVADGLPAAAVLAGPEAGARIWFDALGRALSLSWTGDLAGVEYGGALKNVVAIVAACTRLLYGENAAATVAHGGFQETRRLACAAGALEDTLLGMSGLGDLLVTFASPRSRNRRCGEAIAQGLSLRAWLDTEGSVVEGVGSAYGAARLAGRLDVATPVLRTALALIEGADPQAKIGDLLVRDRLTAASAGTCEP